MIVPSEINKRFSVPSQRRTFLGGTLVDTVKLKERTCAKEEDSIGTVQSIKMFPVTPTFKVLPETNNVNHTLQKITEKCLFFQNRFEEDLSKFAIYCVHSHWIVTV